MRKPEIKSGEVYTDGKRVVEVRGTDIGISCGIVWYSPLFKFAREGSTQMDRAKCLACFSQAFPYTVTGVEIECGSRKAKKVVPGKFYTDGVLLATIGPYYFRRSGQLSSGQVEILTPAATREAELHWAGVAGFLARFPYKVDNLEIVVEETRCRMNEKV